MSSSEKAKTPASFEERNPFDIARHSGPEVAAEIAKRMVAWKTARARTSAAPTTIPGPDANQAPIAAPVQPARMPKAAAQPARSSDSAPRVPFFASASATRRAMPPAPSLKQPAGDQPAPEATEPVTPVAAPMPEQASQPEQAAPIETSAAVDPAPALVEPAVAAPFTTPAQIEDSPLGVAVADVPSEPSAVIEASRREDTQIDEQERIRAEAQAVRARWIAAHDLDSFVEADGSAVAAPAAIAADVGTTAVRRDTPADEPGEGVDATDPAELAARVEPEHDAVLEAAGDAGETPAPAEMPDEASRLPEPVVAEAPPQIVNQADAPFPIDPAALDEIAGRKEPTFEARATPENAGHDQADTVFDTIADRAPDISLAALDEMAGRKEPTFDAPIQQAALEMAPAHQPAAEAAPKAKRGPVDLPRLDTAPIDLAVVRSEPAPAVEPKPAAPIIVPRVKLRPIETRIEARRIDTLRAEPALSAGRPISPHDDGEAWDMPPALAAKTGRARRGTGWAIGLGSVLLIAGITAPAAIWQQGRQDQDRVAVVTPASAPQQASTSASAPAPVATPVPATLSAPPQADGADATQKSTENFDTVLRAIGDGVEVQSAPVMTPPPPAETLANASPAPVGTLMVARPFIPESGDGPFLRAPAGMTPVPPAGAKPGLAVQLKPKVVATAAKPAVSKAKPVARQPKPFFQQSPDQMFDTLIETLTEGRPANPATKPQPPSTRR